MSVGAICFTSSGSNGGCWVVLVFPRLFFEKWGFFSHTRLTPKKKKYPTYTKKKISVEKKTRLTPKKKVYATYAKKKKLRDLRQKKIKKRLTLISTIELRFPPFQICSPCRALGTPEKAGVM